MKEVWPATMLAFPPMLYVGAVVLGSAPTASPWFATLFVVTFLLAILSTFPDPRVRVGTTAALLLLALVAVGALVSGGVGADLIAGILLASPALLLSLALTPDAALSVRFMALALALLDGLELLAARLVVLLSPLAFTGRSFLAAFASVNVTQLQGLAGLLSSTGGPLPIRDTFDPVYVVLAGISAAGVLIPMLRPQTAAGVLLPTEDFRRPSTEEKPSESIEFEPSLAADLADRSLSEPPSSGFPPGLPPLVAGSVAAAGVIGLAFFAPGAALLVLVSGLLGSLAVAILVMRRAYPGPLL